LDLIAICIIPVAVLGAISGSFLNVVIFRLPRSLSISRPKWSVCPHCQTRIQPQHNVPILAWFWLRGKCRSCREPITPVYPLIECLTVLTFIMIWDALFIANTVPTLAAPAHDWPMAVAYIFLFAGLLAMSGMDIESYIIDIRVAVVITIVGVACHAVWGLPDAVLTPAASAATGVLPPALCLAGVAMGLTWLVTHSIGSRWARRKNTLDTPPDPDRPDLDDAHPSSTETDLPTAYTNTADRVFRPLPIAALCCIVLAIGVWQTVESDFQLLSRLSAGGQRGFIACLLLTFLLILASMIPREADDQVIQEIEADRHQARAAARRELRPLIPALAVGIGLLIVLRNTGDLGASWPGVIDACGRFGIPARHATGAALAVAGGVFAAGLGWAVRILGTLAFGKEAFGTGDIYIMAAIGAVAGFWAVLFAFFLAAILGLIGVLPTVFSKGRRAIPFGPWLALGAFATLWLQRPFLDHFGPAGDLLWSVFTNTSATGPGG
jgi:prepilin signal peptidase PulO-like enzyme (type II secretory pathway)